MYLKILVPFLVGWNARLASFGCHINRTRWTSPFFILFPDAFDIRSFFQFQRDVVNRAWGQLVRDFVEPEASQSKGPLKAAQPTERFEYHPKIVGTISNNHQLSFRSNLWHPKTPQKIDKNGWFNGSFIQSDQNSPWYWGNVWKCRLTLVDPSGAPADTCPMPDSPWRYHHLVEHSEAMRETTGFSECRFTPEEYMHCWIVIALNFHPFKGMLYMFRGITLYYIYTIIYITIFIYFHCHWDKSLSAFQSNFSSFLQCSIPANDHLVGSFVETRQIWPLSCTWRTSLICKKPSERLYHGLAQALVPWIPGDSMRKQEGNPTPKPATHHWLFKV